MLKQGLVPGIGDAAYFSPVPPSLVLKDDMLFEIKFSLAPNADTKFAGLPAKTAPEGAVSGAAEGPARRRARLAVAILLRGSRERGQYKGVNP